MSDLISRQDAVDIINGYEEQFNGYIGTPNDSEVYAYARGLLLSIERNISALTSVQPESLSDAYKKAVWTWLLDYQIKVSELEGRYTPYEVLSWVANDWRKEHERFDQQTGGD